MIRLQATLHESSAGILNVPSLQCNGAFNPKYLLAGLGQRGIHQETQTPKLHNSWLANQGISILAQVVFPPVMRMNWVVMAQARLWGQKSRCKRSAPSCSAGARLGSFLPAEIWSRGRGGCDWEKGSVMAASPRSHGQHGVPSGHFTVSQPCTRLSQPCTRLSHLYQPLPVLHKPCHGFLASEWICAVCLWCLADITPQHITHPARLCSYRWSICHMVLLQFI